MSEVEDSAIDAMVDEVMEGREAKEAAAAPQASGPDLEPEVEAEAGVDSKTSSIGFADVSESDGSEPGGSESDELDGDEIEVLRAERDGFLADSQRLAADFANYRKQSDKRVADAAAAQSAGLVRDLILVLDACDAALVQDVESAVGPIRSQLITELTKNGLELLAPEAEELFDPEQHEAVMHEAAAADSEYEGPVIGEVLRAGYTWKGRVVRPAMVKVVG